MDLFASDEEYEAWIRRARRRGENLEITARRLIAAAYTPLTPGVMFWHIRAGLVACERITDMHEVAHDPWFTSELAARLCEAIRTEHAPTEAV